VVYIANLSQCLRLESKHSTMYIKRAGRRFVVTNSHSFLLKIIVATVSNWWNTVCTHCTHCPVHCALVSHPYQLSGRLRRRFMMICDITVSSSWCAISYSINHVIVWIHPLCMILCVCVCVCVCVCSYVCTFCI